MDSSDVLAIACLSAGFHGNPIPFSSSPFSFTLSEGSKIQFLFAAAGKQHNEDIEISDILLIDDYPGKFTQYQKLLRILASCFNHQKWILFRPSHVASCDFADLSVTFDTYYVCSSSEV